MIYTIGHSTRTYDDFFSMLEINKVTHLVDIRSYPSSKFCPQWNKEAMDAHIQTGNSYVRHYTHIEKLGGRRKVDPAYSGVNDGWDHPSFRGYADYMQTLDFDMGLEELVSLSEQEQVAIMCSEAVWWRCHRRMVSDALMAQGDNQVWHIVDRGVNMLHKMTDFISVDYLQGVSRVTYPKTA